MLRGSDDRAASKTCFRIRFVVEIERLILEQACLGDAQSADRRKRQTDTVFLSSFILQPALRLSTHLFTDVGTNSNTGFFQSCTHQSLHDVTFIDDKIAPCTRFRCSS